MVTLKVIKDHEGWTVGNEIETTKERATELVNQHIAEITKDEEVESPKNKGGRPKKAVEVVQEPVVEVPVVEQGEQYGS